MHGQCDAMARPKKNACPSHGSHNKQEQAAADRDGYSCCPAECSTSTTAATHAGSTSSDEEKHAASTHLPALMLHGPHSFCTWQSTALGTCTARHLHLNNL